MNASGRKLFAAAVVLGVALLGASQAMAAISPVTTCDMHGIGSVTLIADGPPVTILTGGTQNRPLCPYPALARYTGGDPNNAANFVCE